MSKVEKEIEFYKDLFSKVLTLFLLTVTGTVTTAFHYGICGWTIAGAFLSFHLAFSLCITGYIYKKKISELEE